MNIFVTSSNYLYSKSQDLSIKNAQKYGNFDKVISYNIDTDIDQNFREKNKSILSTKKGAGLWLWKPYFIYKALIEECNDNDILFYLDAAGFFFKSVKPIINSMQHDNIYAVTLPYIEEEFTKQEAFDIMQINKEEYKKTPQFQASFMAFRKNEITISFVKEWLEYAQNEELISPTVNTALQIPRFNSHKMDQSIFSLLCKKYSVRPHQEPTQFYILGYPYYRGQTYIWHKKKEYPICILLHRMSDFHTFKGKIRFAKHFLAYMFHQIFK